MSEFLQPGAIVDIVRTVTHEVFSTMLTLDAVAGEPYTEVQAPGGCEEVVSFIGLAGSCTGTGSLRCSAATACRLASNFLMSGFESVNDEVLDALGELTNMIIGNLKNQLEDRLGSIGLSIPTVVHGQNFVARSLTREEWTVVPFRWPEGQLDVRICLTAVARHADPLRAGLKQPSLLGS